MSKLINLVASTHNGAYKCYLKPMIDNFQG